MKRFHRKTAKGRLGKYDPLIEKLFPLCHGQAVALTMEFTGPRRIKPTVSVVTLVPGNVLGMRPELIQVSILGTKSGACLVDMLRQTGKGKLMLAGMPSHLAQALLDALFSLTEFYQNGNLP